MELYNKAGKAKDLIKDNQLVLIYFGNNSCGVCKVLKPKVEKLLEEYPNIKTAFIDTDESLDLSATYDIFSLPAILVFAEGKEVIREARHISLRDLNERIARYYSLMFS